MPPTGTASWVTPATPSSAFGTATPCQCRVVPRLRILAGRAVARTAALLDLTTLGLHEAG